MNRRRKFQAGDRVAIDGARLNPGALPALVGTAVGTIQKRRQARLANPDAEGKMALEDYGPPFVVNSGRYVVKLDADERHVCAHEGEMARA
jgi:hypothetical protein